MQALQLARTAGCPSILDIDYRPYSWSSANEQQRVYSQAAQACDMLVGNDEEFGVMAGSLPAGVAAAQRLAREHGKVCVYKMGERGSVTYKQDERIATGVFPVQARKPVGAGDAFMGSLVAALLQDTELDVALRRGSAAAALVVSRFGCASAMPTTQELDEFMASHSEREAKLDAWH